MKPYINANNCFFINEDSIIELVSNIEGVDDKIIKILSDTIENIKTSRYIEDLTQDLDNQEEKLNIAKVEFGYKQHELDQKEESLMQEMEEIMKQKGNLQKQISEFEKTKKDFARKRVNLLKAMKDFNN
jgi:hypothetical protein